MKPSQLIQFLAQAFVARLPVLVVGPPGVGKSACIDAACRQVGAYHLQSHPAVEDPTDVKGFPAPSPDGKTATFLPFGNLAFAMNAERLPEPVLVWNLEDFGQATGAMQASYMQLFLAREVNGKKIPDKVTFVAASNRRTDRANVSGILEPMKSRFATIAPLEPDLDDWCVWAFSHDVDPIFIAYMRFKGLDSLCHFIPSADMDNSPLPRTWAYAAKLYRLGLSDDIWGQVLTGAVGEAEASQFEAFRRLWRELPSIDGIIMDPDGAIIPDKPGTLYATVTALGARVTEQNFPRIARYAERLYEDLQGDFSTLLVRDCIRKIPALKQSTPFVRLMSGPMGQLISGGEV